MKINRDLQHETIKTKWVEQDITDKYKHKESEFGNNWLTYTRKIWYFVSGVLNFIACFPPFNWWYFLFEFYRLNKIVGGKLSRLNWNFIALHIKLLFLFFAHYLQ